MPRPVGLQVATTEGGRFWHYTADGRTTLCGRTVWRVLVTVTGSDCRICETHAGERPKAAR
jgi:hypothetical protein